MSINLAEEILKHDDAEIIEYLAGVASNVRTIYNQAVKSQDPTYLYTASSDVSELFAILKALDRRNKEHTLK